MMTAKKPRLLKPEGGDGEGRNKEVLDIFWRDKDVRHRLGFALDHDSVYKDVDFLIGKQEERISAHKLILRLSSLVFENIISSHELQGLNEIKLPNMSVPMFKRLLKFVYTDELQMHDLGQFLMVAKDFGFTQLPEQALKILKKMKISKGNSLYMLDLSMELNDKELQHYSLTYIQSNAMSVLDADEFVCASYSALCRVLQDDCLQADEMSVFKAVLRWARFKCKMKKLSLAGENIRDILKGARMYVRYTHIPYDKLLADVKDSGILNSAEFVQILKTFIDPSENPLGINTVPRNFKKVESPLLEAMPQNDLQSFSHKTSSVMKASTKSQITLVGKRRQLNNPTDLPYVLSDTNQTSSSMNPLPLMDLMFAEVPFQQPMIPHQDPPYSAVVPDWVCPMPPTEYQFILRDCSIPFNQLISDVFSQDQNRPIEEIILQDVRIFDSLNTSKSFVAPGSKQVGENRAYLSNLKRFVFYQQKDLNCALPDITFMDGSSTKQFLFFETGPDASVPWTYKTLWSLGVNIRIDVKGIKLLDVNHIENSLTISFSNNNVVNEIIQGLGGSPLYPLKTLCLTSCEITTPDSIPAADLQVLILQGVVIKSGDSGFRSISPFRIANKCHFLTRLSIFSPGGCQLALGSDLARSRGVLQSMALSKVRIGGWTKKIMREDLIFRSLEEMYLDVCTWHSSFVEYFPIAFPALRRLAIRSTDCCRVTSTFLKLILSIQSLERVAVFRYVCDDDTHENPNLDIFTPPVKVSSDKDDIHQLLLSAGMTFVNETDVPDFILARDITSPVGWRFLVDFHELDEAHFHCSLLGNFFADSDVSKSIRG